jgi:aminoglycoside phosphotransferase (APT) family kinase protein
MPRRLDVWATPGPAGAAAARVLYQPRNRVRIAAGVVARVLPAPPSQRAFPAPDTQLIVEQIAETTGVKATAAAALHVRGTDRWLYALTSSDHAGVVVKVGKADDEGLAREAATLAALSERETTLQVPVLRWHGECDGWFALVTDIVERRRGSAGAGLEDARAAACALATMNGGFVVHGDLAPWNMVPSPAGLALVDWEKSRFGPDPLCDLAHYVIRSGSLLHWWRPRVAVRHLVGVDSIGRRYLREIGVDPESAAEHLRRYLARPTSRTVNSSSIRRYEIEMVEILSSNPA